MKTASCTKRRQSTVAKKVQQKTRPKKSSKFALKNNKRADKIYRKQKIARWIETDFVISWDSNSSLDDSTNRKRWKTLNEREVLECYYNLDSEWTRKTINYVKDLVQLSLKQIYKWGYEKKRRQNGFKKEEKSPNLRHVTCIGNLNSFKNSDNFNNIVEEMFPEDAIQDTLLSKEQMEIYDKVRDQLIERSEKYEQQSDLDKLLNERIPIKNIVVDAKKSVDKAPNTLDNHAQEEITLPVIKMNKIDNMLMKFKKDCSYSDLWIESIEEKKETVRIDLEEEIINILKDVDSESMEQFDSDNDTQLKDSNNATNDNPTPKSLENHDDNRDSFIKSNMEAYLMMNDEDPFRNGENLNHFSALHILQNIPIGVVMNTQEEIKYESINDHCCSLISFNDELDFD